MEKEVTKTNRLLRVQDMLYDEMKRLSDNDHMKRDGKREIMRSGALSQGVQAYLKSVNTNIKIREMCKTNPLGQETILEELGILHEN